MKQINLITLAFGLLAPAVRGQLPPTPDKSTTQTAPQPRLFVEKRTHELGKILEGDVIEVAWAIENRGAADLVIDRTGAACGCTVVKLRDEDKVIKPGAALNLQVEFNTTGRFGEQNKTIEVFSNDPLEPELKLNIQSQVEQLFRADPTSVMNLRLLRRGEIAEKPLKIVPVAGKGDLTITQIDVESGAPFETRFETFTEGKLKGAKVFFTISDVAALGPLNGSTTIKLRVGDIEREKVFSVRGEVVGDLTWLPRVIDATRQASLPGKSLAPITVSSTDDRPFRILEAGGGPMLAVTVGPGRKPKPGTEYVVQAAVSENAPPGPFGTSLRIVTDSLDQPVVEVPVFGVVASKLEIEPSTVLLRKDGTEAGSRRRVRIKTADATALHIQGVECDSPAVTAGLDARSGGKYSHLVYLEAKLTGSLPQGTHPSVLRITTDVPGAEKVEIPVRIEIP